MTNTDRMEGGAEERKERRGQEQAPVRASRHFIPSQSDLFRLDVWFSDKTFLVPAAQKLHGLEPHSEDAQQLMWNWNLSS